MKPEERYQATLHKKQLDEKYLEKQLLYISQNKSVILFTIRKLKRKSKYKSSNTLIQTNNLIKLLKINQRTLRLLRDEEYIKHSELFGISIYVLSDIYNFLRANNKYQKRKSG